MNNQSSRQSQSTIKSLLDNSNYAKSLYSIRRCDEQHCLTSCISNLLLPNTSRFILAIYFLRMASASLTHTLGISRDKPRVTGANRQPQQWAKVQGQYICSFLLMWFMCCVYLASSTSPFSIVGSLVSYWLETPLMNREPVQETRATLRTVCSCSYLQFLEGVFVRFSWLPCIQLSDYPVDSYPNPYHSHCYLFNPMVKLIVEGQAYEIDEVTRKLMEFIDETAALEGEKEQIVIPNVQYITKQNFERVLELCKIAQFNFPEVAKVKGNNASEYIGNNLADYFSGLSNNEINGIYKVSHFLKMKSLRMTVAAFMACKVYVPLDVLAFNAKKAELGVKNELTPEKSNEFKAKYTFLAV